MTQAIINNGDSGLVARTAINDNFTQLFNPVYGSLTQAGATTTQTAITGANIWTPINMISIVGPNNKSFTMSANGVLEYTDPETRFLPVFINASGASAAGTDIFHWTIGEDSGSGFAPIDATLFIRQSSTTTTIRPIPMFEGVIQVTNTNKYTPMVLNVNDGTDFLTRGLSFSIGDSPI